MFDLDAFIADCDADGCGLDRPAGRAIDDVLAATERSPIPRRRADRPAGPGVAALAIARYLQTTTGVSIRRLVQTLRPLREVTISIAGQTVTARPAIPDDIQTILKKATH